MTKTSSVCFSVCSYLPEAGWLSVLHSLSYIGASQRVCSLNFCSVYFHINHHIWKIIALYKIFCYCGFMKSCKIEIWIRRMLLRMRHAFDFKLLIAHLLILFVMASCLFLWASAHHYLRWGSNVEDGLAMQSSGAHLGKSRAEAPIRIH